MGSFPVGERVLGGPAPPGVAVVSVSAYPRKVAFAHLCIFHPRSPYTPPLPHHVWYYIQYLGRLFVVCITKVWRTFTHLLLFVWFRNAVGATEEM